MTKELNVIRELDETNAEYKKKFKDSFYVIGLGHETNKKAIEILKNAIKNNKPLSEKEFMRKIGVGMSPKGAFT